MISSEFNKDLYSSYEKKDVNKTKKVEDEITLFNNLLDKEIDFPKLVIKAGSSKTNSNEKLVQLLLDNKTFKTNIINLEKNLSLIANIHHNFPKDALTNNYIECYHNDMRIIKTELVEYQKIFNGYKMFIDSYCNEEDYLQKLDYFQDMTKKTVKLLVKTEQSLLSRVGQLKRVQHKEYKRLFKQYDYYYNQRIKNYLKNLSKQLEKTTKDFDDIINQANLDNLDNKEKVLLLAKYSDYKKEIENLHLQIFSQYKNLKINLLYYQMKSYYDLEEPYYTAQNKLGINSLLKSYLNAYYKLIDRKIECKNEILKQLENTTKYSTESSFTSTKKYYLESTLKSEIEKEF